MKAVKNTLRPELNFFLSDIPEETLLTQAAFLSSAAQHYKAALSKQKALFLKAGLLDVPESVNLSDIIAPEPMPDWNTEDEASHWLCPEFLLVNCLDFFQYCWWVLLFLRNIFLFSPDCTSGCLAQKVLREEVSLPGPELLRPAELSTTSHEIQR